MVGDGVGLAWDDGLSFLLRDALEPVDLLTAPHHGSNTSSSAPFVTRVAPRFLIYAAGFRNRWGFPAARVQARWRASGACQLSTGLHGALEFTAGPDDKLRLTQRYRTDGARWLRPQSTGPADDPGCLSGRATN